MREVDIRGMRVANYLIRRGSRYGLDNIIALVAKYQEDFRFGKHSSSHEIRLNLIQNRPLENDSNSDDDD